MIFPPRYVNATRLHVQSMNPVYRAYDTDTQQDVAIKVMKDDPQDPENDRHLRQLFQHEIVLARSLKHPHILEALDAGRARLPHTTVPYITTPFMAEGSLETFVEKSPPWRDWKLQQTLDVILQAASALEYIHRHYKPQPGQAGDGQTPMEARPLIHRDIKLHNFFVRPVYLPERIVHIYLGDFGIARTQRMTLDFTDHSMGTVGSMPPEQFEGQHTPQSDEYSLAFMACFLLTGKYPLYTDAGDQWAWYNLHKLGIRRLPSQLNPRIITSMAVDDVILKALDPDPENRYPSVWQFAKELRSAIEQQIASAPATQANPDQPAVAFETHPAGANDREVDHLYGISEIPTQPVQRERIEVSNFMDDWQVLPPIATESFTSMQLPAPPSSLCWSYDGNYIACCFEDHPPVIFDNQGHKSNELSTGTGHVACWSPSGYRMAISVSYSSRNRDYSRVVIVDNVLEKPLTYPYTLANFPVSSIDGIDWSSKGQLACWVSEQNNILLYTIPQVLAQDIPVQQTLHMSEFECGGLGTLRWSPGGKLLAAGTLDGAVICWRADTGAAVWQKPATQEQVYSLCWSPDGTNLIISSGDGQITMWNVRQNRMVAQWSNLPMVARMLSVNKQGLLVAASRHPYLYFRTINVQDTGYIGKHSGKWFAAWSPTRSEFATLHSENESVLMLWRM